MSFNIIKITCSTSNLSHYAFDQVQSLSWVKLLQWRAQLLTKEGMAVQNLKNKEALDGIIDEKSESWPCYLYQKHNKIKC